MARKKNLQTKMGLSVVLLLCCLAAAHAHVYRTPVPRVLPANYQRALDKAHANWHKESKYSEFVELMEAKGALRGSMGSMKDFEATFTQTKIKTPRRGARIPRAKADMVKAAKGATFFTPLENGDQYPLSFRQACVQFDIPTGTPGLAVNVGLNFAWTWGAKCKAGKPCFMKVEGDLGVGVSGEIGPLKGTAYINGHLEMSASDAIPCTDPDKTEADAKKNSDAEMGQLSAEETPAKPMKGSVDKGKCGHSYMVRRFIRHYISNYFFKDERATQALFQQLLMDQEKLDAEKAVVAEQAYIGRLMKEIQSAATHKANVPFFPEEQPLFRLGRVFNTKMEDYLVPFLKKGSGAEIFTKADLAPWLKNRKDIKKAVHAGMLPNMKWDPVKKTGIPPAEWKPFLNTDKLATGMHAEDVNLPAEMAKVEKDVGKLRELFMWSVRHVAETTMLQIFFQKLGLSAAKRIDYMAGKLPATLDACSTVDVSIYDKFPHSEAVAGASPARKVGETYGAMLPGGDGYHFRATPRMMCSLGKSISNIPTSGPAGSFFWPESRGGRKQLKRKQCKLDAKLCLCKQPNCADQPQCMICEGAHNKEMTDHKTVKEMPKDRMISSFGVSDDHLAAGTWDPTAAFPRAYALPLWTANVFPSLLAKMQELGAKMGSCNAGVNPTPYKAPPRVGKTANDKKCHDDSDCSSGFCYQDGMFSKKKCHPVAGKYGGAAGSVADGGKCYRYWQCKSLDCDSHKCKATKVLKGTNTCKNTLTELFNLFKDDTMLNKMKLDFKAAFGVMGKRDADNVCKGYSPADVDVSTDTPKAVAAKGKCTAADAMKIIVGNDARNPNGLAFAFLNDYALKIEDWAKTSKVAFDKAIANLDAADAYTINWTGELQVGTTFGFGGSHVGFCTPDTNNFQTLTPVLSYSSSFGPRVRSANQGTRATGVSVLVHPVSQVGLGFTLTRDHATHEWNPEIEVRLYLAKSSFGNGGEAGKPLEFDFTSDSVSGLVGDATVAAIINILTEMWFAADGSFETAKAKLNSVVNTIRENPQLLLAGAYLAVTGMAVSQLAQLAAAKLANAAGVAVTRYVLLTITVRKGEVRGKTRPVFSAEIQTLGTVELTIGMGGAAAVKPMIGFGKAADFGALINKVKDVVVKDEASKKPIDFVKEDKCAAIAEKLKNSIKDYKNSKKKAELLQQKVLEHEACDDPDNRSDMCKMCCELMGRVRPSLKTETALNPTQCSAGTATPKRGAKKWFCSGSDDAKEYYDHPASGTKDACTTASLKDDGHDLNEELCKATRAELKTFLRSNTNSGFFGGMFGADQGNSAKGFLREQERLKLYEVANSRCSKAGDTNNDPDCFNEQLCQAGGIACMPGEE